ncbi:hypothetical protein SAMN05661044_00608 [Olivibacter domesticus]|uniref:Uncharacterized protein n=2 Tax=Olivibacter domesticus TaxID=407022 RepID=A0A1H7IA34_OLID1|nr:hypothetical protein SAMN05661044_00608 [Olivibacter domesticus]
MFTHRGLTALLQNESVPKPKIALIDLEDPLLQKEIRKILNREDGSVKNRRTRRRGPNLH